MKVFIHLPTTKEDQEELAKQVAKVHADAVIEHIKNQSDPIENKLRLLKSVQDSAKTT
ncbi:MAG: hypothetical protein R3Y09_01325 [Clostridia bacterium]